MNLKQLKEMYEFSPKGAVFSHGLSEPFSWRGSYDEVAFAITGEMTREQCLENIYKAYNETFYGYKGGEFIFDDTTPVNFEAADACWSDGEYREDYIAKLRDEETYYDRDEYLVKLMLEAKNEHIHYG